MAIPSAVAEQGATVCAHLGYNNVGTLETLLSQDGVFGFLEMNTRIQVEHGVTEEVTGLDLVGLQIKLAQGEHLPQSPQRSGFAIEARVYAEDAVTLLPSPHAAEGNDRIAIGYYETKTNRVHSVL